MIQMISALVAGKATVLDFWRDVVWKSLSAQVIAGKSGQEFVNTV